MSREKRPRSELMFENADRREAQVGEADNKDDPKWLARIAARLRARARQKERNLEHKERQSRRKPRERTR